MKRSLKDDFVTVGSFVFRLLFFVLVWGQFLIGPILQDVGIQLVKIP
jgi:hypothetical protein